MPRTYPLSAMRIGLSTLTCVTRSQFLRHTTGFVGYRAIDFEREEEEGDDTIVNSLQVGLRFALRASLPGETACRRVV